MRVIVEIDTNTGEMIKKYKVSREDALWKDIQLIGETAKLGSQPLRTGKAKRLFKQKIDPIYRDRAYDWIAICRKRYQWAGKEITMDIDDIVILEKLAEICMAI